MSYVVVLPYAHYPDYDECQATLKIPHYDLDNTQRNRGVAGSWNLGIDQMREVDADWLVILSTSMRFGAPGGEDIFENLDAIDNMGGCGRVFFTDTDGGPLGTAGFGYHCAALHRDLIEDVGYFDPNFYPIYFEDSDYNLRINRTGHKTRRARIDATTMGYNRAIELGGVKSPAQPLITYFATKWGIHPDAIGTLFPYVYPFNNPENSIKFFPPANGRTWE